MPLQITNRRCEQKHLANLHEALTCSAVPGRCLLAWNRICRPSPLCVDYSTRLTWGNVLELVLTSCNIELSLTFCDGISIVLACVRANTFQCKLLIPSRCAFSSIKLTCACTDDENEQMLWIQLAQCTFIHSCYGQPVLVWLDLSHKRGNFI